MRISDWSSDVCSSDLIGRLQAAFPVTLIGVRLEPGQRLLAGGRVVADDEVVARVRDVASLVIPYEGIVSTGRELGRASCRERVCQDVEILVVAEALKKKKRTLLKHSNTTTKKT